MWFISSLLLFSCGFYLYYRWFYVVCKHFFQKNCTIRKTLTQIKPIMLSFSVNYTSEIPEDVDRGWFYFFVTLLNQFYWVASATIGGIIGSLRSGFLYDSDNDTDCTSTDSTSKVAGTICYMLILYFL